MLESGESYSAVADWLNEIKFPVGGKSKSSVWNCRLLKWRFRDPRLKGENFWNHSITKRVNKTGRRKRVEQPLKDYNRLRWHRHKRFKFDPLSDAEQF